MDFKCCAQVSVWRIHRPNHGSADNSTADTVLSLTSSDAKKKCKPTAEKELERAEKRDETESGRKCWC